MKFFLKNIAIALLCWFICPSLLAQTNGLSGLSIEDGATVELIDVPEYDLIFHNNEAKVEIKLSYYDDLTYYDTTWELEVPYTYSYTADGAGTPVVTESGSLSVNFKPLGGETYIDRASKIIDLSSILLENESGGTSTLSIGLPILTGLSEIPAAVSIDISHHFDRFFELNLTETIVLTAENATDFGFNNSINPQYLELSWLEQEGARLYELEWLFVEYEECDPALIDCFSLNEIPVDYSNATRIETVDNYYRAPLAYGRGYLLYRVRAVGYSYNKLRVEGAWSNYANSLTATDVNQLVAYKGHERGKNWSYQATYAENGKHKEVLSFYDGSHKSRQTLTVLNEEDHVLVGEAMYDYQGRPSLQMMPYPDENSGLKYYDNQNKTLDNEDYSRKNFDRDEHVKSEFQTGVGYVYGGAEPMTSQNNNGAANYYSTDGTHSVEGVNNEYIPSAEGYPYSRTIYSNDGLNRVLRVGGLGATHETSNGRATEYIYTTINESADLDRLFGNEVGKHGYLKNYTEDANGELSVAYYDQSGRMIASGLLANQNLHPNLLPLDYKPALDQIVNVLNTGEAFVDGVISGSNTIFSPDPVNPTMFNFEYNISETNYLLLCETEELFNNTCRYDVEFLFYDHEWMPLDVQFSSLDVNGTAQDISESSNILSYVNVDADLQVKFDLLLEPGTYHLVKNLSLHEEIISAYEISYINNLTTSLLCAPDTIPYPEEICDCESACEASFESVIDPVSGETSYLDPATNLPMTTEAYTTALSVCIEECEAPDVDLDDKQDFCETIKNQMLMDMGPGGQYFDNSAQENLLGYDANAWLEAMDESISVSESNILENLNENSGFSFADWDEVKCVIAAAEAGLAYADAPTCVTSASMLSYFSGNAWIEDVMMPYHPEYFQYIFHCDEIRVDLAWDNGNNELTSGSNLLLYKAEGILAYKELLYDSAFLSDEELIAKGFFDPLNLVDNSVSVTTATGTYAIPSGLSHFVLAASDPNYDTQEGTDPMHANFELSSYSNTADLFTGTAIANSGGYFIDPTYELTYNYLKNFLPKQSLTDFYTIWDLLAYDDGVGALYTDYPTTYTAAPEYIQYYLNLLYHPTEGMLVEGSPNYMSKYSFFYSRYMFYREYLLYRRSDEAEQKMRLLYPQAYSFMAPGNAFEDQFALGLTSIDWDYHFSDSDIVYTDVNSSEEYCYACENSIVYNRRYPEMLSFDVYQEVDIALIDFADDVLNGVTDLSYPGDLIPAYIDVVNDNELYLTFPEIDDEECAIDCAIKAEMWMTTFQDCDLTEAGKTKLKNRLIEICQSSCDGELDPTTDWSETDTGGIAIDANPPTATSNTIDISITQGGTVLCSDSFEFFVEESVQIDCACTNMQDYMEMKGYEGSTATMGADLVASGLLSDAADFDASWVSYCDGLTAGTGSLSALNGSGDSFPWQWLNCDYIYIPTSAELTMNACHMAWLEEVAGIDEQNDNLIVETGIDFSSNYRDYCKENLDESFTVSHALDEYSYTLYYYDQAGNLIKTVPPAGVDVLLQDNTDPDETDVEAVKSHRNNPFKNFVHPDHNMISNYKYNSLNGIIEETSPDGGHTKFWYDLLGRIIVSQNALQLDNKRFSYVLYDNLGRTIEAGEKADVADGVIYDFDPEYVDEAKITGTILALIKSKNPNLSEADQITLEQTIPNADLLSDLTSVVSFTTDSDIITDIEELLLKITFKQWMSPSLQTMPFLSSDPLISDPIIDAIGTTRYEVVKSFYDDYADIVVSNGALDRFGGTSFNGLFSHVNERNHADNRIASITFTEVYTDTTADEDYNNALHYSYDAHGNIKSMLQEFNAIGMYRMHKRTDYTYDLVSGNVLEVAYQKGQKDQFFHKYHYDSDNRITQVETSIDGLNWDQDASYEYYAHGPLARTELGAKRVQGMDYVYNIHGWLKGVNGTRKSELHDVGKDAYSHPTNDNRYTAKDAFGYSLNYYEGDYIAQADNFLMSFSGNDLGAYTDYKNLYNGNIGQMVSHIADLDVQAGQYTYDQNNRLKEMRVYKPGADLLAAEPFASQSAASDYHATYKYDLNGNLMGMTRNDASGVLMDDFNYRYDGITDANGENLPVANNQLNYVSDAIASTVSTVDMDDQLEGNYTYDKIGQLIKDTEADIVDIVWTLQHKVKEIKYNETHADIAFEYDPMGNRIFKIKKLKNNDGSLKSQLDWEYSYYAHDANGQLMAVYDQTFEEITAGSDYALNSTLSGHPIYGSDRLGMHKALVNEQFSFFGTVDNGKIVANSSFYSTINSPINDTFEREVGKRAYELKNHLGNVLVTVSDRKVATGNSGLIDAYTSDVLSYSDYYPFGMEMPGRNGGGTYRFGFQEQEVDDEVKGEGNSVNFKYRMHDPRLGRFFAVDPLASKYPHNSVYAFSENKVIQFIELEGAEVYFSKAQRAEYGGGFNSPVTVFGFNAAVSLYNGFADMWNYAAKLDEIDNKQGTVFSIESTSKIKSDVTSTVKGIHQYATNTSLDKFTSDIGNTLSEVDTWEGVVGGFAGGAVMKTARLPLVFSGGLKKTVSLVGKSFDIDNFALTNKVVRNAENPGGYSRLSNNPAWDGLIEKHAGLRDGNLDTDFWQAVNDEWWDTYNSTWIDDIIARGDKIKITSDTSKGLYIHGAPTHWKREIDYLRSKGYKEVDGYFIKE